jgi:hypothetical protein
VCCTIRYTITKRMRTESMWPEMDPYAKTNWRMALSSKKQRLFFSRWQPGSNKCQGSHESLFSGLRYLCSTAIGPTYFVGSGRNKCSDQINGLQDWPFGQVEKQNNHLKTGNRILSIWYELRSISKSVSLQNFEGNKSVSICYE